MSRASLYCDIHSIVVADTSRVCVCNPLSLILWRSSRLLHVSSSLVIYLFILLSSILLYGVFLFSSTEGHLSCFQFLTVMNKAVIKLCVRVFKETPVFISVGQILSSGVAGSCDKSTCNL